MPEEIPFSRRNFRVFNMARGTGRLFLICVALGQSLSVTPQRREVGSPARLTGEPFSLPGERQRRFNITLTPITKDNRQNVRDHFARLCLYGLIRLRKVKNQGGAQGKGEQAPRGVLHPSVHACIHLSLHPPTHSSINQSIHPSIRKKCSVR